MDKVEILKKACDIVTGERENQYGTTWRTHARIADYWSTYLDMVVTPSDVAVMMVLLKVARTQGGGFVEDNFVDMCGYSAIAAELRNHENEEEIPIGSKE